MTWARIDDGFDEHEKFEDLDLEHFGLMACAITYCNRRLTDGFISDARLAKFGAGDRSKNEAAAKVLEAHDPPIWKRDEARRGWRIVGYLKHNPSRAEVVASKENKSAQKAAAGRAGGIRSGEARRLKQNEADTKQSASKQTKQNEALSSPLHSIEDPPLSPPVGGEPEAVPPRRPRRAQMTPYPDGFVVSPAIEAMCRERGLPNPHEVLPDFRSSALAKAYRYADWEHAFRNWMKSKITRDSYPPWLAKSGQISITEDTTTERFVAAYASGISAGKGGPYAFPSEQWHVRDLKNMIATFAKNAQGQPYAGPGLLKWIHDMAQEFAAVMVTEGRPDVVCKAFTPAGCVQYLNTNEIDRMKRPA